MKPQYLSAFLNGRQNSRSDIVVRLLLTLGMKLIAWQSPAENRTRIDRLVRSDGLKPTLGHVDKVALGQPTLAADCHLAYNAQLNLYVYTWATSPTWRGSCRELNLKLSDGSNHRALFRLN